MLLAFIALIIALKTNARGKSSVIFPNLMPYAYESSLFWKKNVCTLSMQTKQWTRGPTKMLYVNVCKILVSHLVPIVTLFSLFYVKIQLCLGHWNHAFTLHVSPLLCSNSLPTSGKPWYVSISKTEQTDLCNLCFASKQELELYYGYTKQRCPPSLWIRKSECARGIGNTGTWDTVPSAKPWFAHCLIANGLCPKHICSSI